MDKIDEIKSLLKEYLDYLKLTITEEEIKEKETRLNLIQEILNDSNINILEKEILIKILL